jgi:hypothetical protein
MGEIKSYPFFFIGIIFIFIGWFSVISAIFGFFRAEDLLVVTFKLESMFVDTTFVPASAIVFNLILRMIIGFIIIIIANAFLARGVYGKRYWMHPAFGDFRRLR